MKTLRRISLFLILNVPLGANAQAVEMAEGFRAEGKIYVVIAVAFLVLLIMGLNLITIDRKLKKLEDAFHQKNKK